MLASDKKRVRKSVSAPRFPDTLGQLLPSLFLIPSSFRPLNLETAHIFLPVSHQVLTRFHVETVAPRSRLSLRFFAYLTPPPYLPLVFELWGRPRFSLCSPTVEPNSGLDFHQMVHK